jgi:hypothetical protein
MEMYTGADAEYSVGFTPVCGFQSGRSREACVSNAVERSIHFILSHELEECTFIFCIKMIPTDATQYLDPKAQPISFLLEPKYSSYGIFIASPRG